MSEPENFLRWAFLHRLNLALLGGAVAASLALFNPVPVLIAAGAELLYLGIVPGLPPFKRHVLKLRARDDHAAEQKTAEAMLEALSPNQRESFYALRDLRNRILENYQRVPGGRALAAASTTRMNALLASFVRLLATLNSYRRYLTTTDRKTIEQELAALRADLAAGAGAKERMREVKQRRVEILEKRLERFVRAAESRELISHQLASIDDFMRLLHEQSITLRDPDILGQQLDHLAIEIQATDETVREMERFTAISEELTPSLPPEREHER